MDWVFTVYLLVLHVLQYFLCIQPMSLGYGALVQSELVSFHGAPALSAGGLPLGGLA